MPDPAPPPAALFCPLCAHTGAAAESATVRCNVRRFRARQFHVWRCAACRSLHCEPVSDLAAYYDGYPIRNQSLDYFSRAWYRVVLKRLVAAGLQRQHRILDFGCNQGLFLQFLQENGYADCHGYDPFVPRFSAPSVLEARYDMVVSLDVIEHDLAPGEFLARLAALLKPAGHLCIETPNADGIDLADTEEYLHALHVPYHVHILSQQALSGLAQRLGLRQLVVFNRWYMDAWWPGTARRLFESLLKYGDNDIDSGYEPPRLSLFVRHPVLLVYLVLGYFLPARKTDHMMMVFRAEG
jgi:SAM-dependent methyltransferase